MTELNQIYRCPICGNIVEVLHTGGGELSCCGKPMELLKENTTDGTKEKHVPVITKTEKGYMVNVGEVDHPMLSEHHIEWIELLTDKKIFRKYLKPSEIPNAVFKTDAKEVTAREYCNLHGLWKAK